MPLCRLGPWQGHLQVADHHPSNLREMQRHGPVLTTAHFQALVLVFHFQRHLHRVWCYHHRYHGYYLGLCGLEKPHVLA